jgi:hypothetical protein
MKSLFRMWFMSTRSLRAKDLFVHFRKTRVLLFIIYASLLNVVYPIKYVADVKHHFTQRVLGTLL